MFDSADFPLDFMVSMQKSQAEAGPRHAKAHAMRSESVCKAFFVQWRQSVGSVKCLYLGEISSFYQGKITLMGVKWRRGRKSREEGKSGRKHSNGDMKKEGIIGRKRLVK